MVIFIKRAFQLILVVFIICTHCSCALLAIPVICLINAGQGKTDLSDDFARGHVIGKEYETLQEFYLTQYNDSNSLRFTKRLLTAITYDKNDVRVEVNLYSIIKPMPSKTRFRVCKVLASTSFGTERASQYILATLIDDHGMPIRTNNYQGNPSLIDVTDLFKDTSQMPNEDWTFYPVCELAEEITINDH